MDKVDVPIITCNDGIVHRDRDHSANNAKPVASIRRPSTPGSNWKPGGGITSRKSRDPEKSSRGSRIRSASAGRDPKSELTSRYWSYLFGNLERSISEIYDSCEKQDNVLQCKEVLLILENYVRDFNNLIEWLNLKWSYEQTPPPMRPNALAWEIRKPTFCILPHTRAYEKLVGIVSGNGNKIGLTQQSDQLCSPDSEKSDEGFSSHVAGSDSVTVEKTFPEDSVAIVATTELSNSNPDGCTSLETENKIEPVLSETNQDVECCVDNRVDIGLQTEFDDPDVYYFAGGRNIACQTDPCDQYGPLIPLPSGPTPVIIVLDPMDSDTETSMTMDTSMNELTTFASVLQCTTKLEGVTPEKTDPSSPHTNQPNKTLVESCVETTSENSNNPTNIDTAVNTVVETKSSATQLSVGVLIEECSPASNDGSGDCNLKSLELEVEASIKLEEKAKPVENKGEQIKTKTTFADKAKNGMLRQNSQQAKSVPNNMNRIGTSQNTRGSIQKGKAAPAPPSYRSNIASRCRTAVNTNKQQVLSPVKSKLCSSISSSAGLSSSTPASAKFNCDQSNCKAFWNSKSSGQTKPPTSLSSISTKRTTFTSNTLPSKTLGLTRNETSDKKKHPSGNSNISRQNSASTRTSESRDDPCAGMVRSKSMINPPSSASTRRAGSNNQTRTTNGKKQVESLKTSNNNNNKYQNQNKPNETKGKNFVSLPDVSVHRKRNSTVDEDGWETVRARSNRSKWSPSGSSQSIPLTSEGITNGINACSNNQKSNLSDTENNNSNWKEVDDEGVGEDEEIKKKDEDLDNAIREEELIEEELRQVEKDFEMIENESRDDTTTSENDNAPSPDGMHPLAEMDIEKEQFFFICMDDEAGAKAEDFPPREPGRIVALREKLMSPAKRCDSAETLRKYQAKLAKAERNREKLLQAKYNRYVELSERFEALNETTKKLVSEREELISKAEARLQRAAENRKQHLQNIVKKAHDEDAKAKEIAFINLLEAQNKRHDYLATAHEIEGRLQTIQEERRLKLEERASKAMSVIQRQTRIRCNWQSKLEKIQEKRRKAEERITREKEEKAKERSELAQEKARDREERLSALNAAKQAEKEELQKKIQQKQEDTARRHEENMEQIRQKAIELSVPRNQEENAVPATVRVCSLCKVSLPSEVQELTHLRGRAHIEAVRKAESLPATSNVLENFGLKYVCDLQMDKIDFKLQLDKNRFKTLKKHCKKLMQKLMESGLEHEKLEKPNSSVKGADQDLKTKINKSIRELDRLVTLFENQKGTPAFVQSMDRLMTEIRKTSVKVKAIKDVVVSMGAINVALRVLKCTADDLPDKLRISACNMMIGIIYDSAPNIIHCLCGTTVCNVMEYCAERFSSLIPESSRWISGSSSPTAEQIPYDPVIESLLELLFSILNPVPDPFHGIGKEGALDKEAMESIKSRVLDIIGYLVASSVIDRFAIYCSAVRAPIENQPAVAELLKMILDFLIMNIYAIHYCWTESLLIGKKEADTTQLLATLESSELAGAVSMSYTLLLHQGAPTRPRMTPGIADTEAAQPVPPPPGERTASVVSSTLLLINALARLDHQALQNVLGSEAVSLQFRHIASQLLWQVVPHRSDGNMRRLLNELLIAIAYFTVSNRHNQATIQSGQTPTVLQQLCTLPQEFFRDIRYIKILFPTLISATYGCPENIAILVQHNIDLKALDAFMQSHHASSNDILLKLKFTEPYSMQNGKVDDVPKQNGNGTEEFHPSHILNGHATEIIAS